MIAMALASALAWVIAAPLRAQDVPVAAGERVRLDLRSGGRVAGTIARAGGDTIRFVAERRGLVPTAVAVRDVAGVRRSLGRDRARGIRNGALVGGALGAVVVAVGVAVDRSTDAAVMVPATLLALPAAGLLTLAGAGLGAANAPELWGDARPLRVGAGWTSPRPRVAIGHAVRF